jgi:hypothetical protein
MTIPPLDESAVLAHECTRAYLAKLYEYMSAPKALCDQEQEDRNRVLRSYAKSAIRTICEHMP